jgi:hypothetical protein
MSAGPTVEPAAIQLPGAGSALAARLARMIGGIASRITATSPPTASNPNGVACTSASATNRSPTRKIARADWGVARARGVSGFMGLGMAATFEKFDVAMLDGWRSAQKAFGAQILIDLRPVNAIAAACALPVRALFRCGMQKTRIPGEGG